MNNVSLMAAEVCLAVPDLSAIEDVAFKIIRSPLQYWMISKGHRVDITFTLYRKFIQQKVKFHLFEIVNFDVDQAFAHALTSSYNYTRNSSSSYFVDLVHLAYEDSSLTLLSQPVRLKLRESISELIENWSTAIKMIVQSSDDYSHLNVASIVANYCHLMSMCAQACDNWCKIFATTCLFDSIVEDFQVISQDIIIETTDFCRAFIFMLFKLLCNSSETLKVKKVQQLKSCFHHLCLINNYVTSCDIIHIAGQIMFNFENDETFYIELSILPLVIMLGIKPEKVFTFCPSFVESVQTFIESEQRSRPSGLIKESINNLLLITGNMHNLKKIQNHEFLQIINYLSLETLKFPTGVKPLVIGNTFRSGVTLNYIACLCTTFEKSHMLKGFPDIQVYTRAAMHFSGILFWQLASILDFYVATVSYLCHNTKEYISVDIINDVLNDLHLMMVSTDTRVRELAVKICGDLYLISQSHSIECTNMGRSVQLMWTCLEDKSEAVASKVLDVLWEIIKAEYFEDFLSKIDCLKEYVVLKIQAFLLERQCDEIKPVAYRLLCKLCSNSDLVRYAEICLWQSNFLLSTTVLEHIQTLFIMCVKNSNLKQALDSVITLLAQGWGDLLVSKISSQDISSCRVAASTVESLLDFMKKPEVKVEVTENLLARSRESEPGYSRDDFKLKYLKLQKPFHKVGTKIIDSLGVSLKTQAATQTDEPRLKKARLDILEQDNEFYFEYAIQVFDSLSATISDNCCNDLDQLNLAVRQDDDGIYLDSTKDLPPFELNTELFPSQKCILHLTSQNEKSSVTQKLIIWLVFEEIFRQVNPSLMREESMRSTDEYARNSFAVIYDMEAMLDKSFKTYHIQTEQELTELFMNMLAALQADTLKDNVILDIFLQEILQILKYLHVLFTTQTDVVTYLLKERKILIKPPQDVPEYRFILVKFSDIMKDIAEHKTSFVDKSPSLRSLLDNYLNSNKTLKSVSNEVTDSVCLIDKITSNLLISCNIIDKTKVKQVLQSLQSIELKDLYEVLVIASQSKEELKEDIEHLTHLTREKTLNYLFKTFYFLFGLKT
ncbi:hypothetical protein Btru_035580 [Bulinus truncatus]|nr:hypothetical protein Btru_035580 [Bulinus truncatus]